MQKIAICAAGALVLTLIVVWVFVRAARRQDIKSAVDARRRIGAERSSVDWGNKVEFTESELRMPARPVERKYPGLRAVDSVRRTAPSPSPTGDRHA